jgi:hypothetical protein
VHPTPQQIGSLTAGNEPTPAELQQLGKGLVVMVGFVIPLPTDPPLLKTFSGDDRRICELDKEYRLSICIVCGRVSWKDHWGQVPLEESGPSGVSVADRVLLAVPYDFRVSSSVEC